MEYRINSPENTSQVKKLFRAKLKYIFFDGSDYAEKLLVISKWFSSIFKIRKSSLHNGYFVMPTDRSKIIL